jgi:hypothetical protein
LYGGNNIFCTFLLYKYAIAQGGVLSTAKPTREESCHFDLLLAAFGSWKKKGGFSD